jgi:hypothetical protein
LFEGLEGFEQGFDDIFRMAPPQGFGKCLHQMSEPDWVLLVIRMASMSFLVERQARSAHE